MSLPWEQGREPRATSRGILTQLLSVSAHPSEPDTCLAQWGSNPSRKKPRETHLPQGREGNSSHPAHNPAPPFKTQDWRPSWPCLVDNLDWLTWQNQVFLRVSAQGNRLGVGMESASEERDPEKVVTESSLQTISQTLSGRYYWQL